MGRALIVVDMLDDFVRPTGSLAVPGAGDLIPAIRRELEAAREEGDLVVFVCDSHDPDDREFERFPAHAIGGTPGARVVEELAPLSGEPVLTKRRFDPFFETKLDDLLAARGVTEARVTGVCTHICVMETVAGLSNRDIKTVVPMDAVGDFDQEMAESALKRMQTVFGAELDSA